MTKGGLEPWLEFLCLIHLFSGKESSQKYDQTVLTLAENQGIDTTCIHTDKELFKMKKNSHLQDEVKF